MSTSTLEQCGECGHLYDKERGHTCPSTIAPDWKADARSLLDDASRFVTSERDR